VTSKTPMVGTQLLVRSQVRDQARALAIVRQESVAEVWRAALIAALPALEKQYKRELAALHFALAALDLGPGQISDALLVCVNRGLTVKDLEDMETFPW